MSRKTNAVRASSPLQSARTENRYVYKKKSRNPATTSARNSNTRTASSHFGQASSSVDQLQGQYPQGYVEREAEFQRQKTSNLKLIYAISAAEALGAAQAASSVAQGQLKMPTSRTSRTSRTISSPPSSYFCLNKPQPQQPKVSFPYRAGAGQAASSANNPPMLSEAYNLIRARPLPRRACPLSRHLSVRSVTTAMASPTCLSIAHASRWPGRPNPSESQLSQQALRSCVFC